MFQTDAQFLVEKGGVEALRRTLLKQLRLKFNPLPVSVEGKVEMLPLDELEELVVNIIHSKSLQELGL